MDCDADVPTRKSRLSQVFKIPTSPTTITAQKNGVSMTPLRTAPPTPSRTAPRTPSRTASATPSRTPPTNENRNVNSFINGSATQQQILKAMGNIETLEGYLSMNQVIFIYVLVLFSYMEL